MNLASKVLKWPPLAYVIKPFTGLPSSIRTPIVRTTVVLTALISLGVWQWHFFIHAMFSNIYLNVSIWSTFTFGVVLVYRNMLRMKNEDLAFQALREMYSDARNLNRGTINDPLWRHYRCNELAIVYEKPEILGHAYQLISEELASGRELHVSAGTMQTLADSVQLRLDERKSLTQYIAGILILLGLIGTFIGLMETLASVGKILADLDVRGADPTGAIALLLANLQIPLNGMAVGFSSSLFGAVGSLVLSLMVRFSALAFSTFSQDFEEWLANIVQIDDEGGAVAQANTALAPTTLMEGRQLELVLRAARISVSSNARLNGQLDGLAQALTEMTKTAQGHGQIIEHLTGSVSELREQNRVLAQAMMHNLETTRAALNGVDAKHEIIAATTMMTRQMEARDSSLSQSIRMLDETLSGLRQREKDAEARPSPQSSEAFKLLEELKSSLLKGEMGRMRDRLWAEDDDKDITIDLRQTATGA